MRKTLILITLILNCFGCTANIASGTWENVLKDANGATITTTLTISETLDEFNAAMNTKITGGTPDSIKLPVKDIDFSGYISGKILVVTQIKQSTDPYFKSSTFTVSDDSKTMILSPGGIVFNKM